MGESIPTQEKIRVLAKWLGVPADWLRFGGYDSPHEGPISNNHIDPVYQSLISDLQCLDAYNRKLVLEFVRLVMRLQGSMKN